MAAPDRESEFRREARMPRPSVLTCAAVFGALLSGLIAYMQGNVALAAFTFRLGRVGFFKNWMIATTYAGRSLIVLTIVVLITAAMGALAWSVGVLTWSMMADRTSRVRIALNMVWCRVRHLGRD